MFLVFFFFKHATVLEHHVMYLSYFGKDKDSVLKGAGPQNKKKCWILMELYFTFFIFFRSKKQPIIKIKKDISHLIHEISLLKEK